MTIVDTTTAVAMLSLVLLASVAGLVATAIVLGRVYAAHHAARIAPRQAATPLSPMAASWVGRYGHATH
jgi:hypothetical protein